MSSIQIQEGLWSIILAGGEGERIRPLIERWQGRRTPKQYCAFVGSRSLFQHTLDRADMLTLPEKKVVVAARDHGREVQDQLRGRICGKLFLQPANRGTAAGILLPASHVLAEDPEATVVVYPSDHFVHPEPSFIDFVREAVLASRMLPDRLILLGFPPDDIELEYGWIQPGPVIGSNISRVREVLRFVEKPDLATARLALERGALWNTLVMVCRVKLLWQLGWECFPEIMPSFERLARTHRSSDEESILRQIYCLMPSFNFSVSLLERFSCRMAVLGLKGILWSDWGKGDRIAATLRKIGKRPAFPVDLLAAS